MHVHELNPKKTLAVVIVFVIIIIVGFLTMKKSPLVYQENMQQSLQVVQNNDGQFYPYQLVNVLNDKNSKVVLIDLRNKFAFGQGHIPGAYSIPAYDLTKKKNITQLKTWQENGTTVVLYGNDQLEANGPWMFFRQVGYSNVKYLLGGYSYFKAHKANLAETKDDNTYVMGIARCDYAKVAKSSVKSGSATSTTKKPVIFKRRKKAAVAAGGC